jgi:hypothetical protein
MSTLILIGIFVALFVLAMKGQDDREVAHDRFRKGYRDDD